MTSERFATAYLKAIEKRHSNFFVGTKTKIINYVTVTSADRVSVQVIGDELPDEILYDITAMFWLDS